MIASFWITQPTDLIPDDAAGSLKRIIEQVERLDLEVTQGSDRSFENFMADRIERKCPGTDSKGSQAN